jgi:release factor glutamine methyltransferase
MTVQPSARIRLAEAAARLREAGIDNPAREARWLAEHAPDPAAFAALVARRAAHEPLAYLLGTAPFWTLTLNVSPATLIPRLDSETLILAVLAAFPDRAAPLRVLDLGTGTGCLLLAVLHEFPRAWGIGADRVERACRLAQANAALNGLAARCAMLCADWAAPLACQFDLQFDLVLSNPPYIPSAEIPALMPEVARHEPATALDGGADGLDAYRRLIRALDPLLAPGGRAMFELGAGQGAEVSALAAQAGWACTLRQDTAGHQRALILDRPAG